MSGGAARRRRTVLIANPSADVYGADLQMLQSVVGLVEAGWRVVVVAPGDGPLVPRLQERGAEVFFLDYPVLRRGDLNPKGLARTAVHAAGALPKAVRLIRYVRADAVLVNTVTLPWWLVAGRLARTPVLGHVHEVETASHRLVRSGLIAPLRLADRVLLNSAFSKESMVEVQPRLERRAEVIFNGVEEPPGEPRSYAERQAARGTGPLRMAVIGRLTPRKAPDVAIEAVARLVADGYRVELEVVGSAFTGMEWYEQELRERAARPDLAGRVQFTGYASPIWPVLDRADVLLAPSTHESFGNAIVEAQLAERPVVAADIPGHRQTVIDGETGLLVAVNDPVAMAAAVRRLADDPALAGRLASTGRSEAVRRFSVQRYRRELAAAVGAVAR